MLANLVGIVGGCSTSRRQLVEDLLDKMPHGDLDGVKLVVDHERATFGWRQVVWEGSTNPDWGVARYPEWGLLVAIDGRLDKCQELGIELGVSTASWAELVCRGYRAHEERLFERLDGDYAIALYDARAARLVLARDIAGKRSLHWARGADGTIAFASFAMGALRGAGLPFEPVPMALWREALQLHSERWPEVLEGVHLSRRNRVVIFESNGTDRELERSIHNVDGRGLDEDGIVAAYRVELADSTRRSLSHVPGRLGVTLSGGLDSSAVLGAMRSAFGPDKPIVAITIAPFGDAHDDIPFASDSASFAAAQWCCVESALTTPSDEVVAWSANPLAAARSCNAWEVVRVARDSGIRTLALGASGDYLGGHGNNSNWWALREKGWKGLAARFRGSGDLSRLRIIRSLIATMVRAYLPDGMLPRLRHAVSNAEMEDYAAMCRLLAADPAQQADLERIRADIWKSMRLPRTSYLEYLDLAIDRIIEREMNSWDVLGRVAGVELVSPIATRQIIALARLAPLSLRHSEGRNRTLLRQAAAGWLPQSVAKRRQKASYNTHFEQIWRKALRSGLPPLDGPLGRIYSPQACAQAYCSVETASPSTIFALYSALMCAKWMQMNLQAC